MAGRKLTPEQAEFLLAEFKTAWDMVLSIDNRRGVFASYYTVLFGAALSVVSGIIAGHRGLDLATCIGLTGLLLLVSIAGHMITRILRSERGANTRYRKKINLIREIFLGDAASSAIKRYLRHKELGVLLLSDKDQPRGDGRTLGPIFWMIRLQQAAALLAIVGLWALWFFGNVVPARL